jgi:hypothetical protein
MVRTQIYLTEQERRALRALSRSSGSKQSELIRTAIDRLLAEQGGLQREAALERLAGAWRDRRDLTDFLALRGELDRTWRP